HLPAENGSSSRSKQDGIWHEPHALGERSISGRDAELDLFLQPSLPYRIPSLVVLPDMAIAPAPRKLIRIVRRLVRDIGEEGFAIAVAGPDKLDQLVGVCFGRVIALGKLPQISPILGVDGFW